MDYKRLIIAFSLLYYSAFLSYASDVDSIGIKREESGIYVLHRVDPQETLYALSRRYGTSVESIVENNQITGNSLSVGLVLRIPWQHGLTHVVQTAETLYSISKKYEIGLDDIKSWNQLTDSYVRAGDTLVLSEPAELLVDEKNQVTQPEVANSTPTAEPSTQPEYAIEEKKVVKSTDVAPVKENGMASVIDGTSDTKKYLALHRTAPVGTIMRVRNEMTNLSVFVRVVGKLPDTGANNNVLLRLSKAAQEALGALDDKFRVELSYIPNQ